MTLFEVAKEISGRLSGIFYVTRGCRPVYGGTGVQTIRTGATKSSSHEYFHGDNGRGWEQPPGPADRRRRAAS